MKLRKREILNMLASALLTVAALLVIYAIKGIYPFGSGSVLGGDLYQLYLPNFYHIFDAFHGSSPFFDYTVAGGFERNMLVNIFQPTTWFLMLLKRSWIVNSISYLLIAKLAAVAVCASLVFSRLYKKLSTVWTVFISLLYTFSGYCLVCYTNINWLDIVALYPLLIYAMLKMFEGRTKLVYVLILTYLLTVYTYFAFFVVVSLIVFGGAYLFIAVEKDKRKGQIYSLGAGTLISLVSSAYPLLYNLKNLFLSARFEKYGSKGETASSKMTGLLKIIFSGFTKDIIATLILIGMELAFACVIVMAIRCIKKKELRRMTAFFAVCTAFIVLQPLCRGTDLLWHGGSRVMFPYRNGYMAAFIGCLIIGYYMTHVMPDVKREGSLIKKLLPFAFAGAFAAGAAVWSGRFYAITKSFDVVSVTGEQTKYFVPLWVLIVLLTLMYTALLFIKNRRAGSALLLVCAFPLLFWNAFGFIGNYEGSAVSEKYNGYFSDCFEAGEYFKENDKFERVSNPELSLITNYSYFADTVSVSNWMNSLDQNQIQTYKNLGYATVYTRTLDSGATAFSKALVRTTNSVSKAPLNEMLYEETGTTQSGIICYNNRYVLPFGVNADDSLNKISFENYGNTFDYQNAIFKSLGGKAKLFEKLDYADDGHVSLSVYDYSQQYGVPKMPRATGTVYVGKAVFNVKKNSTLYFMFSNNYSRICRLYVNGELLHFYKNAEAADREVNTFFPVGFNNNIAELGSFDGGRVEIEYEILDGTVNDMDVYCMDGDRLAALCSEVPQTQYSLKKDVLTVSVDCSKDGYVFLPLTYSAKRICTVNGKPATQEAVLGNLTAVKVNKGANEIVLKMSKTSAVLLTLLIFISFAVSAAFVYLESLVKRKPDKLLTLAQIAFGALAAAAVLLLYIVPAGAGIIRIIV